MTWEGVPEDKSIEATSENRHRGCGHDMLRQAVPSTDSSNWEARSMVHSHVRWTVSDSEEAEP